MCIHLIEELTDARGIHFKVHGTLFVAAKGLNLNLQSSIKLEEGATPLKGKQLLLKRGPDGWTPADVAKTNLITFRSTGIPAEVVDRVLSRAKLIADRALTALPYSEARKAYEAWRQASYEYTQTIGGTPQRHAADIKRTATANQLKQLVLGQE